MRNEVQEDQQGKEDDELPSVVAVSQEALTAASHLTTPKRKASWRLPPTYKEDCKVEDNTRQKKDNQARRHQIKLLEKKDSPARPTEA